MNWLLLLSGAAALGFGNVHNIAGQETATSIAPAVAPTEIIGTVDDPGAVQSFLEKLAVSVDDKTPRAVVARTVDGGLAYPRITLIYMTQGGWCGSGGCTLFILRPDGADLVELGRVSVTNPPVRVLTTRSHGMPDISVQVRSDYYPGPGPKFVALSFDGETYASNPTTPSTRLLDGEPEEEVVISERDVYDAFRR
jgi:hypothetical protein